MIVRSCVPRLSCQTPSVYVPGGTFSILNVPSSFDYGEVRVVDHADEGMHPAMDVAFHANHHFRLDEICAPAAHHPRPGCGSIHD